uniref:Uncharacterized protein n=1 Tax=Anguilla anguilla TaxID=7936 RepID=A0A0E9U1W6_ANGAN
MLYSEIAHHPGEKE